VQDFSRDLSLEISKVVATFSQQDDSGDADIEAIHNQLNEVKPGTAEHHALTQEQKEVKKLAKRLVKAVKESLEDALKKESALKGREHEEELRKLDSMGIFASSRSTDVDDVEEGKATVKHRSNSNVSAVAGASPGDDTEMRDVDERTDEAVIRLDIPGADTMAIPARKHQHNSSAASCASSSHDHTAKTTSDKPTEPLSPPISTNSSTQAGAANAPNPDTTAEDANDVFAHGGVPWYLEPFDPVGTTVHEERYTGRAVLRDMSEELSDMDEDTLTELAPISVEATPNGKGSPVKGIDAGETETQAPAKKKASAKKKSGRRRR